MRNKPEWLDRHKQTRMRHSTLPGSCLFDFFDMGVGGSGYLEAQSRAKDPGRGDGNAVIRSVVKGILEGKIPC